MPTGSRRAIVSPGRPRRTRTRTRKQRRVGQRALISEGEFAGVEPLIKKNPPQNEFRPGDYLHVSDLVYKCSRMIALSKHLDLPIRGEPILDSRGVCFQIGRAIQDYVTERIKTNMPDQLWGNWSCRCGEVEAEGCTYSEILDEPACHQCGTPPTNYVETVWRSEAYKLTGAIDILLKLPGNILYPVEVKSISGARFDEVTRAVPDHLIQALFYWHLLQENGKNVMDQASILYVKKEFVFANPYKEILIQPSNYENRITDFFDEARELKTYMYDDGPLPVRTTCSHPLSPGAKECPFALQCFAIDPPPERNSD
jgi:Holliday junction resolvase-like predicted endonuclease